MKSLHQENYSTYWQLNCFAWIVEDIINRLGIYRYLVVILDSILSVDHHRLCWSFKILLRLCWPPGPLFPKGEGRNFDTGKSSPRAFGASPLLQLPSSVQVSPQPTSLFTL